MPLPKMSRPTSEITVGLPSSKGATCIFEANTEIPRNITARNEPMITKVFLAFLHSGGRNADTPLEMASTPVTAAPPDAKAWATTYSEAPINKPSPGWPAWRSPGLSRGSTGSSPKTSLAKPHTSMMAMVTRKKYVGTLKIRPD
jgi:hypothetical protein